MHKVGRVRERWGENHKEWKEVRLGGGNDVLSTFGVVKMSRAFARDVFVTQSSTFIKVSQSPIQPLSLSVGLRMVSPSG